MPRKRGPITKGGCLTCRKRKVKCDTLLPSCSACRRLRLDCVQQRDQPKVSWMPSYNPNECTNDVDDDRELISGKRRTALFSEDDRAAMCLQMSATLHQTIDRVIENVDLQLPGDTSNPECPFGILNFTQNSEQQHQSDEAEQSDVHHATTTEIENLWDDLPDNFDETFFPYSPSRVPNGDLGITSMNDIFSFNSGLGLSEIIPARSPDHLQDSPSPSITLLPSLSPKTSLNFDHEKASFLINYYRSKMVNVFSPLVSEKSPWKIMHLPSALQTFAELMLGHDVSHARAAVFYAMLSISAFGLDRVEREIQDQTSYWWKVGEMYRLFAKERLANCIQDEICGPKKSKYKDILMAFISMATISVVSGQQRDARCFLLDVEQLIRFRGLPKPRKSRKVSMLHSLFLYSRIIEESTFMYPLSTKEGLFNASNDGTINETTAAQWSFEVPSPEVRFPSLRTHDLFKQKSVIRVEDLEQQFMHPPEPNATPGTIFESVYGIPSSLLALISYTTHLGHEAKYQLVAEKPKLSKSFAARDKATEDAICNWKNPYSETCRPSEGTRNCEDDIIRSLMSDLVEAIHAGVLIYFYRLVRNLNPIVLQHHVGHAIDRLLSFEEKKKAQSFSNAAVCWPGFIAGSEALGKEHREQISGWLLRSGQSSGMRHFDTARDVLMQVWEQRNESGNNYASWTDIIRQNNIALVLT